MPGKDFLTNGSTVQAFISFWPLQVYISTKKPTNIPTLELLKCGAFNISEGISKAAGVKNYIKKVLCL